MGTSLHELVLTGCSAAVACLVWNQKVGGSIPPTLTINVLICYTMNIKKSSYNSDTHKQECKSHYQRNKQYYLDRNKRRIAEFRKIIAEAKGNTCKDCKREYHQCQLDFDHTGDDKNFTIAHLGEIHSKKALLEEIAKCEVVCASCHRLRTYNRGSSNSRTAPSEGAYIGANPVPRTTGQ